MSPLAEAVVVWQWVLGQFAGERDGQMMVPFGGAVLDGTIWSVHQEQWLILQVFIGELHIMSGERIMS
jgi:hypothetical protein